MGDEVDPGSRPGTEAADARSASREPAEQRPSVGAPSVRVRGLSIELDHEPVLNGLDLDVPAGELTVLMGASGSGKTVLMKQMVGLLAPDKGTIWIGDLDVWGSSTAELDEVRRDLSVLHAGSTVYDGSVYASLTVREQLLAGLHERHVNPPGRPTRRAAANPYFKPWNEGIPRPTAVPELFDRAQDWLERFGLTGIADRRPHEIAAGLRRRAALAAALAVDVSLYLLDDPDGAIDALHRAVVTDSLLRTHRSARATMLVTTHDAELAGAVADRIAVLAGGRIVYQGDPRTALRRLDEWYRQDPTASPAEAAASPVVVLPPRRSGHDQAIPESTGTRRNIANLVALVVAVLCLVVAALVGIHLWASLGPGRP